MEGGYARGRGFRASVRFSVIHSNFSAMYYAFYFIARNFALLASQYNNDVIIEITPLIINDNRNIFLLSCATIDSKLLKIYLEKLDYYYYLRDRQKFLLISPYFVSERIHSFHVFWNIIFSPFQHNRE